MWNIIKHMLRCLPDSAYISLKYFYHFKKLPNLRNPKTFNEKLQWLKLHDRKEIYTDMVDKYEAKRYIAKRLGEEYIVPTYGVWDKFDDINFDELPEQFVLKCTHDCGGLVICKDKSKLDLEAARLKINKCLKHNYFWECREWPYKNVKPRIMAEEYIENSDEKYKDKSLIVYKVFCFDGVPQIIQVILNDKQSDETIDYFDANWELLKLKQNFPNSEERIEKPDCLNEMLDLSSKLSKNVPFLRVDWYIVAGNLLFSEFTFYSDAGVAKFEPEEWDYKLGTLIDL